MMAVLKRIGAELAAFLPHIVMSYSLMMLVFSVINYLNTAMQFLDSRLSQRFELLYAIFALGEVICALIAKRLRIPALCFAAVTAAFVVPVIRALAAGLGTYLTEPYFKIIALVMCLAGLAFSIADIVVSRRNAAAEAAES